MIITIISLSHRPQFEVSADISMAVLRQMVAHKFGYQAIGVPHSFIGILN
jgi:hypothetical protein